MVAARCVGPLATAYTMEQPFRKDRPGLRFGLDVRVPPAPAATPSNEPANEEHQHRYQHGTGKGK